MLYSQDGKTEYRRYYKLPRHTRCLNVRLEEEMLLLEGLDL